jgi:hypothetical protein
MGEKQCRHGDQDALFYEMNYDINKIYDLYIAWCILCIIKLDGARRAMYIECSIGSLAFRFTKSAYVVGVGERAKTTRCVVPAIVSAGPPLDALLT